MEKISFTIPAKWILAGEHTVLRGGEALVFPLPQKHLTLTYEDTKGVLEILVEGEKKGEIELVIWSVLEKALSQLNISRYQIRGRITINGNISFGSGMGASATLCVALTRWLSYLSLLKPELKYEFAKNLEDLFHGESSGVDVAVTLEQKPILFTRKGYWVFDHFVLPNLYLSHTGTRGITKDCVTQVKKMHVEDVKRAQEIDDKMKQTVEEFKELLMAEPKTFNERGHIAKWVNSINRAHQCFEAWGLVNEQVRKHCQELKNRGALATKLTGSGGGGFVLSMWSSTPPNNLPFELIACHEGEPALISNTISNSNI